MNPIYLLDTSRSYICDSFLDTNGLPEDPEAILWTRDPILPAPIWGPKYVGGEVLSTGEVIGGTWEDPLAPSNIDPEEQQLQLVREQLRQLGQSILDAKAKERDYDNIFTLCTYATSTVPKFRAEGQAGVEWRDQLWTLGYQLEEEVRQGLRPVPTQEEFIALLPEFKWPDE